MIPDDKAKAETNARAKRKRATEKGSSEEPGETTERRNFTSMDGGGGESGGAGGRNELQREERVMPETEEDRGRRGQKQVKKKTA